MASSIFDVASVHLCNHPEVNAVRWIVAAVALSVVSLAGLGSGLPQFLQPNTTAYSAEEVSVLIEAIATLEQVLSDGSQGSRRPFVADEWQSRDFASYTAGRLAEFGYEVLLAGQSGWPDGEHVWVLVGYNTRGNHK